MLLESIYAFRNYNMKSDKLTFTKSYICLNIQGEFKLYLFKHARKVQTLGTCIWKASMVLEKHACIQKLLHGRGTQTF